MNKTKNNNDQNINKNNNDEFKKGARHEIPTAIRC